MSSATTESGSFGNQGGTSPASDALAPSIAAPAPAVKPAAPASLADWMGLLSPEQQRAVNAIIAGKDSDEVAADAGVSREMLRHWRMADPMFMSALAAWRRETMEETRAWVRNELVPLAREAVARMEREKAAGRRR